MPYTTLGPDGYVGFQPLFTEWQQYQPTNVEIGGTTVGSYDVFETDYATPWSDESIYNFGSATSAGTDPSGLAGATVTDSAFYPSFNAATSSGRRTMSPPRSMTSTWCWATAKWIISSPRRRARTTPWMTQGLAQLSGLKCPGPATLPLIWSGLADTSAALANVENLSSLLPPDGWYPGI